MSGEATVGDDHRTSDTGLGTALRVVLLAVPILLVIAVIVIATVITRTPDDSPIALGTVTAPAADSAACTGLLDALPENLGDQAPRAPLADPAPAGAAAWRFSTDSPTAPDEIVLRCGLDRPAEFTVAAPLQLVDDVQWFQISGAEQGFDASTWFAVDREVYVALTLPSGTGPDPIQLVSEAISATLPAQQIDPAPIG